MKKIISLLFFVILSTTNAQNNVKPKGVLIQDYNTKTFCNILLNAGIEILEKDSHKEIKINLENGKKSECYIRWDSKNEFLTFSNYRDLKDGIERDELDKLVSDTNTFTHNKARLLVEDNLIYGIVFSFDFWIKDGFVEKALPSALANFKSECFEKSILNFVKE